jgi:hypothetical protein
MISQSHTGALERCMVRGEVEGCPLVGPPTDLRGKAKKKWKTEVDGFTSPRSGYPAKIILIPPREGCYSANGSRLTSGRWIADVDRVLARGGQHGSS